MARDAEHVKILLGWGAAVIEPDCWYWLNRNDDWETDTLLAWETAVPDYAYASS